MKKHITILLLLLLCLLIPTTAYAASNETVKATISKFKMYFDGSQANGKVLTYNKVNYIPVTLLTDKLGFKVSTSLKTNKMTITEKVNKEDLLSENERLKDQINELTEKLNQYKTTETDIKVYNEDQELKMTNDSGQQIYALSKNGIVYLPVKTVVESLNKAYLWDATTNIIYIGKHDSDVPSVMLYELDYYKKGGTSSTSLVDYSTLIDNYDNVYSNGTVHHDYIGGGNKNAWRSYMVDGKYRKVKGKFFILEGASANSGSAVVKIYSGSQVVYTSPLLEAGMKAISFEADITGATSISIEITEMKSGGLIEEFGYADVGLYQ